jgi:hypothetical protein
MPNRTEKEKTRMTKKNRRIASFYIRAFLIACVSPLLIIVKIMLIIYGSEQVSRKLFRNWDRN